MKKASVLQIALQIALVLIFSACTDDGDTGDTDSTTCTATCASYEQCVAGSCELKAGACATSDDCSGGTPICSATNICESVAGCQDDDIANDEQSAVVVGAFTQTHQLCGEDSDWYAFDLLAGDLVVINVNSFGDDDIDIRLHNAEGDAVASSSTIAAEETIGYLATTPGIYTLVVYDYAAAASTDISYSITVRTTCENDVECPGVFLTCGTDAKCSGSCPEDGIGATAAAATAGQLNTTVTDLAICEGAEDWFSFTLAEGQLLYVVASYDAGDVDLDIFDVIPTANTEPVAWSFSADGGRGVTHVATAAGTHYLRITGEASYSLMARDSCLRTVECGDDLVCLRDGSCGVLPTCNADATCSAISLMDTTIDLVCTLVDRGGICASFDDPACDTDVDDKLSEATALTLGAEVAGNFCYTTIMSVDQDWYTVVLSESGHLTTTINTTSGDDLDIRVYDDQLNLLKAAEGIDVPEPPVLTSYLLAGTYYISVLGYISSTSIGDYTLVADFVGAGCTTANDCNTSAITRSNCFSGGCIFAVAELGADIGELCETERNCQVGQSCFDRHDGIAAYENYCTERCFGDDDCDAGMYCSDFPTGSRICMFDCPNAQWCADLSELDVADVSCFENKCSYGG